MGTFVQPPFWAIWPRYRPAIHAVSVLVTPPASVLTIDEAKGYARRPADDENTLLQDFIRSAMAHVEQETGLALLTQTRDVYFDRLPSGAIELPAQSMPLQSVTSIKSTSTDNTTITTVDPTNYIVDVASARIALTDAGTWPTDLRLFQPWTIRLVAGWTSVAFLPPMLKHAVGLLTGYFANDGRDRFVARELHDQYDELIGPYRLVTVA